MTSKSPGAIRIHAPQSLFPSRNRRPGVSAVVVDGALYLTAWDGIGSVATTCLSLPQAAWLGRWLLAKAQQKDRQG